jgi:DNA-binding NarL/FixJ family response regulator
VLIQIGSNVKNTARKSPLKVCILSPHPWALAEFSRMLSPPVFHALTLRLCSTIRPELGLSALPPAPAYVVDACSSRHATTAIIAKVLERSPSARLLIVSEKLNGVESDDLLRLGAKGLLTYAEAREKLPRALPFVAAGGFWVPRPLLSAFVDSVLEGTRGRRLEMRRAAELSGREQEVLDALLENLGDKEIEGRLNISKYTVRFHVSNLLSKFGVRRRADLIFLCYREQKSPKTSD